MTPMEALECGTIHGAKYVGLDGDIGSLEAGKLADLIVMEKGTDPTKNIRHSERIQYVMINGEFYNASTMIPYGETEPTAPQFFWDEGFQGIGLGIPQPDHCSNCPGSHYWSW